MSDGWTSVKERLPAVGSTVLVAVYGEVRLADFGLGGWWVHDYWLLEPTHWMPLPAPPQFDESEHVDPERKAP